MSAMAFALQWPLLLGVGLLVVLESTARPHPDASYDSHLSSLELAIIKCIVETVPGVTKGGGVSYDWSVVRSRSKELQGAEVEVVQVRDRDPDFSRGSVSRGYPDDWSLVRSVSSHLDRQRGYPVSGYNERGGDFDNWAIVRSISTELHLEPVYSPDVPISQPAYPPPKAQAMIPNDELPTIAGIDISLGGAPISKVSREGTSGGRVSDWSIEPSISSELPSENVPDVPVNQPTYSQNYDFTGREAMIPYDELPTMAGIDIRLGGGPISEVSRERTSGGGVSDLSIERSISSELPSENVPDVPVNQPTYSQNYNFAERERFSYGKSEQQSLRNDAGGSTHQIPGGQNNEGGDVGIVRSISSEFPSENDQDVPGNQPTYSQNYNFAGKEGFSDEKSEQQSLRNDAGGSTRQIPGGQNNEGGDVGIVRSISSELPSENVQDVPGNQPTYSQNYNFAGREGFSDSKSEQQSLRNDAGGSTHQIPGGQNNEGGDVGIVRSISSELPSENVPVNQPTYYQNNDFAGREGFADGKSEQQSFRNDAGGSTHQIPRGQNNRDGVVGFNIVHSISSELPSENVPDVPVNQPTYSQNDDFAGREGFTDEKSEQQSFRNDAGGSTHQIPRGQNNKDGVVRFNIDHSISSELPSENVPDVPVNQPTYSQNDDFAGREGFTDEKSEQQSFPNDAGGSTHQIPRGQNNKDGVVGFNTVHSISSEQEPTKSEEVFSSGSQQTVPTSGTQAEIGDTDDYNVFPAFSTELQPADNEPEEIPASITDIVPPPEAQTGEGDSSWNNPELNAGGHSEVQSPENVETTPLESPQPCETGHRRIKNVCRKVYTFQLKSKVR